MSLFFLPTRQIFINLKTVLLFFLNENCTFKSIIFWLKFISHAVITRLVPLTHAFFSYRFPDFGHDKRKCQKCQSVNIVFMIAALWKTRAPALVVNIELKWGLSSLDSASGVRFLFFTPPRGRIKSRLVAKSTPSDFLFFFWRED